MLLQAGANCVSMTVFQNVWGDRYIGLQWENLRGKASGPLGVWDLRAAISQGNQPLNCLGISDNKFTWTSCFWSQKIWINIHIFLFDFSIIWFKDGYKLQVQLDQSIMIFHESNRRWIEGKLNWDKLKGVEVNEWDSFSGAGKKSPINSHQPPMCHQSRKSLPHPQLLHYLKHSIESNKFQKSFK